MTLLIPLATMLAMRIVVTLALPLQAPIVVATGSGLYPRVVHDSQTAPVRQVMTRGTIIAIFFAACTSFRPPSLVVSCHFSIPACSDALR